LTETVLNGGNLLMVRGKIKQVSFTMKMVNSTTLYQNV